MTIDITKFNAVLSAVDDAVDYATVARSQTNEADPDNEFADTFINIFSNLGEVEAWANAKILEADQEQVMSSFLAEMKVVFEKYSATISTMSFEDGYGQTYGEPGTGFLLTASLDGVISTKEIKKSVIESGELV